MALGRTSVTVASISITCRASRLADHARIGPLRDAVYHWAPVAIQLDPVSKAKYAALRGRGHGHVRALRSVSDRLLAVTCAMLRTQTCYQASTAGGGSCGLISTLDAGLQPRFGKR